MPTDPLKLPLREIHYPDVVSWWPLAIGWWLLFIFIVLLILTIFYLYRRKIKYQNSKELHARLEFEVVKQEWHKHQDKKILLNDLSGFLRRISINFYSREEVASLTNDEWLTFLDKHVDNKEFTRGAGMLFRDSPYRKTETINPNQLLELCENWVANITRGSKAS